MCIVYMYYCPNCKLEKRNYRRWPRFCQQPYCHKLQRKANWTDSTPCFEKPCLPAECGTVTRDKNVLCPDCRFKIAWQKQYEPVMAKPPTDVNETL